MKSDEAFLKEVKQQLQSSSNELDELTLAKLGAARRRAVEAAGKPLLARYADVIALGHGRMAILLLAGLLFVVSVVMLKLTYPPVQQQLQPLTLLEDMALLGSAEELEFYQDLDFYLWVMDEQDSG
jgi:hypothetical protein